jgi:hypothetical protein
MRLDKLGFCPNVDDAVLESILSVLQAAYPPEYLPRFGRTLRRNLQNGLLQPEIDGTVLGRCALRSSAQCKDPIARWLAITSSAHTASSLPIHGLLLATKRIMEP